MSFSQVNQCLSCQYGISFEMLLPHLAAVIVEEAEVSGDCVWLRARARADDAACPRCACSSGKVHSTYQRRLSDAAIGGRRVRILLRIRRLFCVNPGCRARTFAEQVDGLTSRRSRKTPPLARALASIALALAGRAGARLAGALDLTASRSSMLRLVMALPDPETGALAIVGIDDFAFRRGRDYGTIVINVETGRPVDLLRDREAATVADWLKEHPGIKVICRDRAGAYADGARQGAPDADQVADRWHIYHNLCEHVGKAAARHRSCLEEPAPEEPEQPAAPDARQAPDLQQAAIDAAARRVEESALAVRTRQRYDLVQSLKAQGKGIKPIKRETGLAKETVRRFYYAETVGELLVKVKDGRPSILDEHKPYLHQRWNDGVTNVIQLHAELKERGYKGSYGTVRDYVLPFREAGAAPPAVPGPPKARDLARWITADPDNLDDDEKAELAKATERCPDLDALARHVTEFAKILTGRHGDRLDDWITAVEADDQPDLHSFVRGIKRDYDAVLNGLTMPWSSGVVEGNGRHRRLTGRYAEQDVFRRRAMSVNVPGRTPSLGLMNTLASWAGQLAQALIQEPLPRRWAHVQGVAARARGLAPVLGADADLLEAAAWLHDIGYAPSLALTGLHQLDGARYLRDTQHTDALLCRLVAHHSCAIIEAGERGLADVLNSEFDPAPDVLASVLTCCDMTTSPDGQPVPAEGRRAEIHDRYGSGHPVSRSIQRATPMILRAVEQVHHRAAQTA